MINAAAKMVDADRPYLLGETFSGVDILMTTTLDWAIKYNQPLPDLFTAYLDRLTARPGYAAALDANHAE
jgi:glutathione S-transferase